MQIKRNVFSQLAFHPDDLNLFQLIADQQDEQLELVSGTIGVLKNMSERIGMELDEQAV